MCDILKNKIKKYIDFVVYTVKSKIDRHIGKIASENLQTLPQMIKNKSALPTGNPTAANTKTAATTASTSTNSTTMSTPQPILAKPATSTVKKNTLKQI